MVREPKIYDLVLYGDPVLETPAAPVTRFDSELRELVENMFATMYMAHGVGLAAPQIGISKRIAVIDISSGKDPKAKIVAINPEIVSSEGGQKEDEGCLSLPGFREGVKRPVRVTIRAQDAKGKEFTMQGEGLLARAFCHETDHLNGRLFISHLSVLKREVILRKVRKMTKAGEW